MHEMSIVQSLISIIEEEMVKNKASVLRSVRVKIGVMSGIVREVLRTCFEVLTSKTDIKGGVLKMDIAPLIGYCRRCKGNFEVIEYNFSCPHCDSTDIEIISGREMNIVELEIE
jgi:hydrogenase nickel incorporation protein HypA/HybF